MPKLGPLYYRYKPTNKRLLSGYRVCISTRNAEIAGFKKGDELKITAEKGKITIEVAKEMSKIE